jgi:hypothetical protein
MFVPGKRTWPVEGTVAIGVSRSPLRTDLLLDPGPYTRAERSIHVLYPPSPPPSSPRPTSSSSAAGFTILTYPAPPIIAEAPAPYWIRSIALTHAGESFKGWQARVAAFGWPLPAVYWLWDWRTETLSGGVVTTPKSGVAPPNPGVPDRAVPWRFIWINLALDTLLYAATLLLPYALFHTIRRLRRRREGLCPRCAYNRAGLAPSAACPECGTSPLLR